MAGTKSETIRESVEGYLGQLPLGYTPDPPTIQTDILEIIRRDIATENQSRPKGCQWKCPSELPPTVIAAIILHLYPIVFLSCRASNDCGILAIQEDASGKIIYNADETEITKIIRQYQYDLPAKSIRETLTHLQDQAPRVYLESDPMLISSGFSSIVQGRVPKELIVKMLLATDEIRILKSGGKSDERLIVQHYSNGVRTGIWEIVNIMDPDKNYGTLGMIITNLSGVISPNAKQEILLSLRDRLKNPAGGQSKLLSEGFDNRIIPCRNGVFDGRDHTFTEYTDPVFLEKFGEVPFTYKLDTAYNPDALRTVPAKWDPVLGLAQLFAGKTQRARELADEVRAMVWSQSHARTGAAAKASITDRSIEACSLRVLLTMYQLAVRNYSGREGNIVFLDNLAGQRSGHNGKSTASDLIKFIIDHSSNQEYAMRTSQPVFHDFANGKRILSVPIDKWGDDFSMGEDIRYALMICSDEVWEAGKIPHPGAIKNFARRQPVRHNVKYKPQFDYAFRGLLLHMQNGAANFEAKDGAMFEHAIHLRFEQDFSRQGGNMDSKIKTDYVVDEDIAEYMLALILEMDFVDDYDPEDLKQLEVNKDAVVYENKPVYRFLERYFDEIPLHRHSVELMMLLFGNWCKTENENAHGQIKASQFRADVDEWCGRHKDRFVVQFDRDWRFTKAEAGYMTTIKFDGLECYGGGPPLTGARYTLQDHQISSNGCFAQSAITRKFRHQVIDLSQPALSQGPAPNAAAQVQPWTADCGLPKRRWNSAQAAVRNRRTTAWRGLTCGGLVLTADGMEKG